MKKINYFLQKIFGLFLSKPIIAKNKTTGYSLVKSYRINSHISEKSMVYAPFNLFNVKIGEYSYITQNANISNTSIGKFCSIGPNFCCGPGLHPTNGVSTSPMFYSTEKQNGFSLADKSKFKETLQTTIGNDVFIGANVTVLDGVSISDGAIIGAGAVVVSDIPEYAIAVGVPAKVIKYRFKKDIIDKLKISEWWNLPEDKLKLIEQNFFDPESFLKSIN